VDPISRLAHALKGMGVRALAVSLAVTSVLILGPASVALGSSSHRHHPSPQIQVLVKPAAVDAGAGVNVAGRIAHPGKSGAYRIDLQTKLGKKFSTVVTAKPTAKHRYSLDYRPSATSGTVKLRVRLRRGGRELSHSRPWSLSVRGRQPAAPASPTSRTLVLDPATVLSVPAPGEAGTLRLAGYVDLRVGDVIAIGLGPNTPNGFLGRITSVSHDDTSTTAETVPATLPEALPEGEFSQHVDGGEVDSETSAVRNSESAPASSGDSSSTNGLGPIPVKVSFHCAAGAKVQVAGSVALNPTIDIDAGWSPFGGVHARFVGKATASAELSASADAAASCQVGPQLLFKRVLRPITFSVGPVPVVVVPVASAYLSAEGKVEVSVDSEIHGSVTASAGIEYSHGDAHPVGGFEKEFGWTPPDPQGSAHLGAKVSPTLDLLIYGVGGPQAQFDVGLAVDADLFNDPAWTLTAPVALTAKLAIPALHISSPTLTVYQHTFLLAQAGDDPVQGLIHFDEFSQGTAITDQYRDLGVIFDSPVFISSDGANPTSPVLSGTPQFVGPIVGHFVKPGTDTPTTVNVLQLDAGYIDNPGSVEIVATLSDGRTRTAIADHLGIDQISISTRGIRSFSAQAVSQEDAGFAIDNLGFGP
jgi:hypothetical protein